MSGSTLVTVDVPWDILVRLGLEPGAEVGEDDFRTLVGPLASLPRPELEATQDRLRGHRRAALVAAFIWLCWVPSLFLAIRLLGYPWPEQAGDPYLWLMHVVSAPALYVVVLSLGISSVLGVKGHLPMCALGWSNALDVVVQTLFHAGMAPPCGWARWAALAAAFALLIPAFMLLCGHYRRMALARPTDPTDPDDGIGINAHSLGWEGNRLGQVRRAS